MTRAAGVVGRGTLVGPSYRRLLHSVYQAADLTVDHGTMISAVREAGAGEVLCGPSAAWALGCRLADPDGPVHLSTGRGGTGRDAAVIARHRADLTPAEIVETPWGLSTSPARTAVDLARGIGTGHAGYVGGVVWVDGLLRATALPAAQARGALISAVGLRGLTRARAVIRAARDGVDSPRETQLRLMVVRFGFPEPQVQCPVPDGRGHPVAHLDLGWGLRRVGLEYDGAVHRERDQHSGDLRRLNEVRSLGWHVLQIDNWAFSRPGAWLRQLDTLVPRR